MKIESALEQLLPPYLSRVQVRPGNGLSRNMNATLRSYRELPLIMSRTVECLASLEYLFGFTETVSVHYIDLYQILTNAHEDWHLEVPVFPSAPDADAIIFVRRPRVPMHRFMAAWTIARRINLLAGRGAIRLHNDVLAEMRWLVTPLKGGDSHMDGRGPPTPVRQGPQVHGMTRYDLA